MEEHKEIFVDPHNEIEIRIGEKPKFKGLGEALSEKIAVIDKLEAERASKQGLGVSISSQPSDEVYPWLTKE